MVGQIAVNKLVGARGHKELNVGVCVMDSLCEFQTVQVACSNVGEEKPNSWMLGEYHLRFMSIASLVHLHTDLRDCIGGNRPRQGLMSEFPFLS